ncbi:MAG: FecR domain-containing protein [Candidatus Cloacimonetes bacterium]|nr:FecR domain-containing protein [Candidatus Cloacimonadota bacterium]
MKTGKLLVIVILQIVLCSFLTAENSVAKAVKVKGEVKLTRDFEITEISIGDEFINKDELSTKEKSFAAIKFTDESSIIKLFPNSSLLINTEQDGEKLNKNNFLRMGELWAKVTKQTGTFAIETPTTVVSVKGTEFLASIDENGETDITTLEGEVFLKNKFNDIEALIKKGETAHSDGRGEIKVVPFDLKKIDKSKRKFLEETYQSQDSIKADVKGKASDEMKSSGEKSGSSGKGWNMGGSVGTVMMGDNIYTQIRLMPEITFGKFGIGLDVDLMIDSDGNIREEDWDEWEDYVNKFYYIRYARRGDPFFGRIGGFPSYTLGQGLVMRDYSNMLRYPEVRQIGLQLGGKIPVAGLEIEGFTSNILKNEIFGGRLSFLPLGSTDIPLLKKIRFGATAAHDVNQIKGLLDSDDDNYPDVYDDFPYNKTEHNDVDHNIEFYHEIYSELYPDSSEASFTDWFENSPTLNGLRNPSFSELGKDDVTVVGVDYELPLVESKLFYLSHYSEVAKILDHNLGIIFPGFYSKFLIFHMNLEFRLYQENFIPAFFDNIYEEQRATVIGDTVFAKEDFIDGTPESKGWYGSLTADLFHLLFLTVSYEDMYGKDNFNTRSLWATAKLNTDFIPKFNTAKITYSQVGFDNLEHFKTPAALVTGTLGYSIAANTELVGKYQERYVDYDGNGEINGKEETIKTMGFGVEFRF